MSEIGLQWFLRMFDLLNMEAKLDLLSQLTQKVKDAYSRNSDKALQEEEERKKAILKKLMKSWEDYDIDGDMIVNSRTISDKVYDL